MTVKLMATIYRWNCNSSDTKPNSGVPEGSTIHYIDTGEEFIYHNDMWEPDRRLINALKQV